MPPRLYLETTISNYLMARRDVLTLLLFALLCPVVPSRAQSNVGESAAFAFDTRDYTTGLATESMTFAFDTRLVDGLQGAVMSVNFTFDTRGAPAPPRIPALMT